jgi:signal transduction histidine kinase
LQTKPRDQARVVRRSADHLSGLIDGILDISKIEAGRLYLSRDEVQDWETASRLRWGDIRFFRDFRRLQQRLGIVVKLRANLGHAKATRSPVQQGYAQNAFELSYAVAQSGLRKS